MSFSETLRRSSPILAGVALLSVLAGCTGSPAQPSLEDVQRVQTKFKKALLAMEAALHEGHEVGDLRPLTRQIGEQIQARDLAGAEASIGELRARLKRAAAAAPQP